MQPASRSLLNRAVSTAALILPAACGGSGSAVTVIAPHDPTTLFRTQQRVLPRLIDHTTGVVLADFDRSGTLDVFVANALGTNLGRQNRLLLNRGGTFQDVTELSLPAEREPTPAAAGVDVDGDRDTDLVVIAPESAVIYVNDGAGRFTRGWSSIGAPRFRCLATGDLDNDGDIDLVVAGAGHSLLFNDSTGAFVEVTGRVVPDPTSVVAVALTDLNADGYLDLVSATQSEIRVFLNDRQARFTSPRLLPGPPSNIAAIAIGDVNLDGLADVIFAGRDSAESQLYLGSGNGSFTHVAGAFAGASGTSSVALADFNLDGALDVVFGSVGVTGPFPQRSRGALHFANDGRGNFAETDRIPVTRSLTTAVAAGDVDGNGFPDVVAGKAIGGASRLLLNTGNRFVDPDAEPRFPHYPDPTIAVAAIDIEGDGDQDLVWGVPWTDHTSKELVWWNDGTGTFRRLLQDLPSHGESRSFAVGDMNGDGLLDLVVGRAAVESPSPPTCADIVLINEARVRGPGHFREIVIGGGDITNCVVLADVDGDRDLDVFLGTTSMSLTERRNRLYLNDGNAWLTDATETALPRETHLVTTSASFADLDGDGDLDLVCSSESMSGTGLRLYFNDGRGKFTEANRGLPAGEERALTTADLDGDGDVDIVTSIGNLYVNDGHGYFASARDRMLGDRPNQWFVRTADLDHDGDTDIVWCGTKLIVGLNDGTGMFRLGSYEDSASSNDAWPIGVAGLEIADFDLDGDLDVVTSASRVFWNRYRHLAGLHPALTAQIYRMELSMSPGAADPGLLGVPYVSLSQRPQPLPIPGIGRWALGDLGLLVLPPVVVPPHTGVATIELALPAIPSLGGLTLYSQALLTRGSSLDGARLTNLVSEPILGRR